MAVLRNLARVRSATVGAGALTLGAAVTGFLTFAQAGVLNGETVSYGIFDYDGAGNHTGSEVGRGVYNAGAGTLTRVPLDSTNGGAALVLSGNEHVFLTILTEDMDHASGSIANVGTNTHVQIDTHIASVANPHNVTAWQVGAYTTAQADALFQPLDADTSAIAALGFTTTAFLKKTALNTWVLDTQTYEPADATIVKTGNASWIDLTDGNLTTLHKHQDLNTVVAPVTNILTLTNAAASTLALNITAAKTLTLTAADNYTIVFPASGTVPLLATANVFTAAQKININSTTALFVEQDGVKDNTFIVDTTNNVVLAGGAYIAGQLGGGNIAIQIVGSSAGSLRGPRFSITATDNTSLTSPGVQMYISSTTFAGGFIYYQPTNIAGFYGPNTSMALAMDANRYVYAGGMIGTAFSPVAQISSQPIAAADLAIRLIGHASQTGALLDTTDSAFAVQNKISNPAASGAAYETVFNENGNALLDFRVETDTYNALFVDASNESIVIMSNAAGKVGMFGVAAVVQPAGAAQAALTNSTGGANDGTLVDVTTIGVAEPAKVNDNFTDIFTLLNAMRTAMVNLGSMKGAA